MDVESRRSYTLRCGAVSPPVLLRSPSLIMEKEGRTMMKLFRTLALTRDVAAASRSRPACGWVTQPARRPKSLWDPGRSSQRPLSRAKKRSIVWSEPDWLPDVGRQWPLFDRGHPCWASQVRVQRPYGGTAEENKRPFEGSTFPNWNGTDQKRLFTLSGDQLTLTNPTPSVAGAGTFRVVWKRTK